MESENDTYVTQTDADGYFEIILRKGDYDIRIQKDNYKEHQDELTVQSNDEIEHNVDLEPLHAGDNGVFGSVTDQETGEPVVNARIRLYGDDYYSQYSA